MEFVVRFICGLQFKFELSELRKLNDELTLRKTVLEFQFKLQATYRSYNKFIRKIDSPAVKFQIPRLSVRIWAILVEFKFLYRS